MAIMSGQVDSINRDLRNTKVADPHAFRMAVEGFKLRLPPQLHKVRPVLYCIYM